jgi:hypothetical protein
MENYPHLPLARVRTTQAAVYVALLLCLYEVSFSGKFANVGQRSGSGNDDIGGREVSDFGKLVGIDQDEATGKHDRIDLVEATRERAGETPGFPAEPGGSHELHAAFLNESRTRGHC